MDSISEARLQLVMPALSDKIHTLATMLETAGVVIRITQGLRTWAEQDALYAQGRTAQGNIVTNAKGGQSWHNFGVAVDFVPMDQIPPAPDWNVNHPVWQQIIKAGESLGLYSGDEFEHVQKDEPHFQLTGRFPVSPDDEARSIYANEGQQAFWNEVNAS